MGTRRKTPSMDDVGKMVYSLTLSEAEKTTLDYNWNNWTKDRKRHYVKLAVEIWREVEKCL